MNHDQITQLLKDYRSYRYAVTQYERHRPLAQAGVANYSAMPSGSGAPELFFTQQGRMADMGNTSLQDAIDYGKYLEIVKEIEGALETLTDEEQSVIRLKWMDKMSLRQIAQRKDLSIGTIKNRHKSALASLGVCFRFSRPPQIEDIHTHLHHGNARKRETELY